MDHDAPAGPAMLDHAGLDALIAGLRHDGFAAFGPRLRDGAVGVGPVASVADLPRGIRDAQGPGRYRLDARGDGALFAHAPGPESWKRLLHPPRQPLWHTEGQGAGMRLMPEPPDASPLALIGVRACDLAAIGVLDRVLAGGEYPEPHYAARRAGAFVVAVNCAVSGDLCFCVSMGTGPAAGPGHDIALTELPGADPPLLLAEAATPAGRARLAALGARPATAAERAAGRAATAGAAAMQSRAMPRGAAALAAVPEHPHWADVAARCVSCANCTLVCPTCFCTTVEDRTDLAGTGAERVRRWDSCFTADFSHIHGGSVRAAGAARYRQWLTHKLSTWHAQFGSSGCVGCGRCVAWCPVGIDLVAEAQALCAPVPEPAP